MTLYAVAFTEPGKPPFVGPLDSVDGVPYAWSEDLQFPFQVGPLGHVLTPEETAAHLLGAPAEAFVLEPCKP